LSRKKSRDKKRRREKKLRRWPAALKQKGSQSLLDNAADTLGVPRDEVLAVTMPGPKLSERIRKLVEPCLDDVQDDEQACRLIDVAVLAWNLTQFPADERRERVEEVAWRLSSGDPGMYATGLSLFTSLIERKLALFPRDERMVASYELLPTKQGWRLNVVALVPPGPEGGSDQPPTRSEEHPNPGA